MSDDCVIRPARAEDADAIDSILRTAFARTEYGHQGEAELVTALRADGDVVLEQVAERAGVIVGTILFSHMDVEADGARIVAAGLAPVAVAPELQGQDVGGALIRAGLSDLREQGCAISFVLGHADYYTRFGYSPDLAARFASPFAGPHFMAKMLADGEWPSNGRADYAPAFDRLG